MRFPLLLALAGLAGTAHGEALTPSAAPAAPAATATAARRPQLPLTSEVFVASLARDLATHFKLEGDLQLEQLRPWTLPSRVAGQWTVTILEFPTIPSSSMLVRCRVLADGQPVADPTIVLRASLWREAWTTVQPVNYGDGFDATLLEPRRIDHFRERDAVPVSVGDRTYVFSRAIPAGRLLTWRDIARRPLVKKGQVVEVSAVEGLLLVSMKALALENGARGDTVTVRNPESQKNFAATVVDENRVQVRF